MPFLKNGILMRKKKKKWKADTDKVEENYRNHSYHEIKIKFK